MHLHLVGHGTVEAAGLDVQIDLVLRLVGHHVHACGLEFAQGPLLLRAALEHADLHALERGRTVVLGALLHHDGAGGLVIAVGEVHHARALGGDRHGADDHVVLLGLQAGDDAVPLRLDEHALALDLRAQRVGNIHVEAHDLARGGLGLKGLVGGVQAHAQVSGEGSASQGCDGQGKKCFAHENIPYGNGKGAIVAAPQETGGNALI